jgi:glycosidase
VNVAAQQHDSHSLLNQMRRMIGARRAHAVFGDGDLSWWRPAIRRWRFTGEEQREQILVVNNLAGEDRTAWMSLAEACGQTCGFDERRNVRCGCGWEAGMRLKRMNIVVACSR